MPQFTFFKMRSGSAINSFDIEVFDTIEMAKLHAQTILMNSTYDAIEVYEGECSSLVKRISDY